MALWHGGCFGKGLWSRSRPEKSQEPLQLCLEEVIFLAHHLRVLRLVATGSAKVLNANGDQDPAASNDQKEISGQEFWQHALHHRFPSALSSSKLSLSEYYSLVRNLVLARYVVYHYYRALGWTVRNGMKYGADWALYERSPSLEHSTYAVTVVPLVLVATKGQAEERVLTDGGTTISWCDYFTSLRLLVNVKKSLRYCFVVAVVERQDQQQDDGLASPEQVQQLRSLYTDPDACLSYFQVRNYDFRRWEPERTRDPAEAATSAPVTLQAHVIPTPQTPE